MSLVVRSLGGGTRDSHQDHHLGGLPAPAGITTAHGFSTF